MIFTTHYASPLGDILIAECGGALIGLWIAGQDYMSDLHGKSVEERETPLLVRTKAWLSRYFAGERPAIAELPLAPRGSLVPARGALPEFPRRPGSRSVRGGKRRPGRIVPLRTRPRRHHNRAIMRKSSGTFGGPTRTILPERHNREPGGAADRPRCAAKGRGPTPTTTRPEPPTEWGA